MNYLGIMDKIQISYGVNISYVNSATSANQLLYGKLYGVSKSNNDIH